MEHLSEVAEAAFLRAATGAGELAEYRLRVAGVGLCLRFAGRALLPGLTRAFRHLPVEGVEVPDLTVSIWDGVSTGSAFPPIPGMNPETGPTSGKLVLGGSASQSMALSAKLDSGVISLLDLAGNRGYFFVPDAFRLPVSEMGAPLLAILHNWLVSRGALIAHAGAIGFAEGGVLLVGRGGSGKSTTALACARDGLGYAADDYCLLTQEPEVTAHGLYSSAKVDDAGLGRLGLATASGEQRIGDKRLLFLAEHGPGKLIPSFPVRAVLLPRLDAGNQARLEPVSAAEALRALAPSTLLQLPGASARLLQSLAAVVRDRPCYTLALGNDLASATALIRGLIEAKS